MSRGISFIFRRITTERIWEIDANGKFINVEGKKKPPLLSRVVFTSASLFSRQQYCKSRYRGGNSTDERDAFLSQKKKKNQRRYQYFLAAISKKNKNIVDFSFRTLRRGFVFYLFILLPKRIL